MDPECGGKCRPACEECIAWACRAIERELSTNESLADFVNKPMEIPK